MNLQTIIKSNLILYDSIKPKHSDGNYTVIATINDLKTGELLALASGTKANLRKYPHDIEDCHAESLVKRAYKRYLINRISRFLSQSNDIKDVNEFFERSFPQNLILFVSQFPCGFVKRYEGKDAIDDVTGTTLPRKPGRGTVIDGKTVYVTKSDCNSKIHRWLADGMQGKKLKQLFNIRGDIKLIVVGNCESDEDFAYNSQLESFRNSLSSSNGSIQVEFIDCVRRDEFLFDTSKAPLPEALVWWATPSDYDRDRDSSKTKRIKVINSEYIVDGRRKGLTKRQCVQDNPYHRLMISNPRHRTDLDQLEASYEKLLLHNDNSGQT